MANKRKGFTLIELLVVIAVIALLLAILMPTLRKAKEAAMRIRCGSRLKQWGMAIHMYVSDNHEKLMRIGQYWPIGNGRPYPHYINIRYDEQGGQAVWSIEGINPYINAFGSNFANDGIATDMITCPNCSGDFMMRWAKEVNWPSHPFVEFAYSYFAGFDNIIDSLPDTQYSSNAKDVLVTDTLRSNRLLMAEILNLDTSDGAYRYNHGKTGWSWNEAGGIKPPAGRTTKSPNPKAIGRSQLFGDGHIEWRNISTVDNLPIMSDRDVDEWNGPGSGWMSPGDDTSYF
ncbi:MAG: type II secretion system protein [Planctomycetes bacterium]|nr:type II secretion system protein [Planctomycetota bacterium]